jgi:hypothetical protein
VGGYINNVIIADTDGDRWKTRAPGPLAVWLYRESPAGIFSMTNVNVDCS